MSHPSIRATLVCALLATLFTAASAVTQEEVDAATLEQKLAEARKATAQAEEAEAKAKLGTLDTSKLTRPTGDAKTLNVEGSLLAYSAVNRIAESIATTLKPTIGSAPVVIYSEKEVNALVGSRAFLKNLRILDKAMANFVVPPLAADNEDCREPDEGGAGLGPLGSIDAALQVLSIFRVDKKMEGADVTVDGFALASVVIAKLKDKGIDAVAYPGLYVAGAFTDPGQDAFSGSETARLLDGLADRQVTVDMRLADISRRREDVKSRQQDKRNLTRACSGSFAEANTVYDNLEVRGKAMKARADKYTAAATTVDEKTGASLLQVLVQSEQMSKAFPGAYVLQLKPVAAGGTTLTKTNLLYTSFRISGGAIVAYMLVRGTDGMLAASGTVSEYGGYVAPEDLQAHVRPNQAAGK